LTPLTLRNADGVCGTLTVRCISQAVQFHPNSSYLATGSTDKTVRLWAVNDAKLVRVFPGHKGAVQALSFSPDGKFIASAGNCMLCSNAFVCVCVCNRLHFTCHITLSISSL